MDINTVFGISHSAVILILSMYNIFKLQKWIILHMHVNIAKDAFLINANLDNILHLLEQKRK